MNTWKSIVGFFIIVTLILTVNSGSGIPYSNEIIKEDSPFKQNDLNNEGLQVKPHYQFVGAEKCASVCHNNEKMGFQYNVWKTSLHSGAFNILISKKGEKYAKKAGIKENPQESSACLRCHITGGELDSSYFTANYRREDGITCEACHKQIADGKTYLTREVDCLKCHNDSGHKMHKFKFREMSLKIAHPRPPKKSPEKP